MRSFIVALVILFSFQAKASWEIQSEFEMHLSNSLFDKVIEDFWASLQGTQNIPIADFVVTPAGIPVRISGIHAEVNYAFPLPARAPATREWTLSSNKLGARLFVNNVSATQTIVKVINGVVVRIRINAECNNIVLRLPEGLTNINATIGAQVVDSQVKLALKNFEADWQQGAWQVESMNCTGLEGLGEMVGQAALDALKSFQRFDGEVRTALVNQFASWSRNASVLLLSERELPAQNDYMRMFYNPSQAYDNGDGIELKGMIRFVYPYLSPRQDIVQTFGLENVGSVKTTGTDPLLRLPFATIRALMMGEYFAGKLEYSMKAKDIPAFTTLMKSRWTQFLAWPDLMRYAPDTQFAFQFQPSGPPSFVDEKNSGKNRISGNLNLPLSVRMYVPIEGVYTPYVEFHSLLDGNTNLTLLDKGKINFQIQMENLPLTYTWSQKYVNEYAPSQRIAADKMASAMKDSLNQQGFKLTMPTITVGKSLKLEPTNWVLEGKNLRLNFTTAR